MATLIKLKTMTDSDIREWLRKVDKIGVISLEYALLGADDEVKERCSVTCQVKLLPYLKKI